MTLKWAYLIAGVLAAESGLAEANGQSLLQRAFTQLSTPRADDVLPPPATPGSPTTPAGRSVMVSALGVQVAPVTADVVRTEGLVVQSGAVITRIDQGSPAASAGLPIGGVIVAIDGRRIDSPEDLLQAVRAIPAGQDVELTYYQRDRMARRRVPIARVQAPALLAPPGTDTRDSLGGGAGARVPPPILPPMSGTPTLPPGPPGRLERDLGGNGSRPLLGRIGRILEGVVAPAQAVEPAVAPPVTVQIESDSELASLRQQVQQLQTQLQALQRQVETLERRLAEWN